MNGNLYIYYYGMCLFCFVITPYPSQNKPWDSLVVLFVLTKSPQQSSVHICYFINFQTNGAKVIEFEMIFVIEN